jgi:hypothetical protein
VNLEPGILSVCGPISGCKILINIHHLEAVGPLGGWAGGAQTRLSSFALVTFGRRWRRRIDPKERNFVSQHQHFGEFGPGNM